jgi:zinc transport system substrate-binding protein
MDMKKILAAALALALFLLSSGCAAAEKPQSGRLRVVASFYPMYDFAKKIGGDKADVSIMVPAGSEPHDWEPSTSDIVKLEDADIFVYNGNGMELWAQDLLYSTNNGGLVSIEASRGVPGLVSSDPHVWLDPKRAKDELANIKEAFKKADPENASCYENNYKKYAAEMDALDTEYRETLSACPGKDIVVAHAAFGYLCESYGLNQIPIEGINAESEPDPARMAEIVAFVREKGINVIFFEELISPKVAETIAAETGAVTAVLNPIGGLTGEQAAAGEDYFSMMRKNLAELKKALS